MTNPYRYSSSCHKITTYVSMKHEKNNRGEKDKPILRIVERTEQRSKNAFLLLHDPEKGNTTKNCIIF